MPTLVALHAHPDDEAIFTGGLLVRAARAGWRTVVVLATSGEAGSMPGLAVGDTGAHRRAEAEAACRELDVDRLVVLPFVDSGAAPGRPREGALAWADPRAVAELLDAALEGEEPTVVTTYDARGIYGHPDHVAVHCVGRLLAEAGVDVYESTIDRRHLHGVRDDLVGRRVLAPWRWPADLTARIGSHAREGALLPLALSPDELAAKTAAIAAHGSQMAFGSAFMGLPPGAFHRLLDHEWFRPTGERRHHGFEALLAGHHAPVAPATAPT